MNQSVLLDAKTEYTNQLVNFLWERIYEGIESIYNHAKKINYNNKNILKLFQTYLTEVPNWDDDTLRKEYKRIKDKSQCNWLEELLTAVFVSYTKVLTSIKNSSKKINLKIPKMTSFIHKCYINTARKIWKRPDLFYDKIQNIEKQKNMVEIEQIIKITIEETIRKELPIQKILFEYLGNDYNDDIDDNINEYLDGERLMENLVKEDFQSIEKINDTDKYSEIILDTTNNNRDIDVKSSNSIKASGNFPKISTTTTTTNNNNISMKIEENNNNNVINTQDVYTIENKSIDVQTLEQAPGKPFDTQTI